MSKASKLPGLDMNDMEQRTIGAHSRAAGAAQLLRSSRASLRAVVTVERARFLALGLSALALGAVVSGMTIAMSKHEIAGSGSRAQLVAGLDPQQAAHQ